MVTSPINPMRYWKLEEIQSMLNEIEGYENVVVEFQYTPSHGWNSDHWDCKCGIKEQLVSGDWNWLLKYEFQVNDKLELADVRLAAFQEMATRLVTDVWRTSINSFRNEQKQLMDPQQYKLNQALLEKLKKKSNITNDETTNTTDEMKKMNNIIQTNNNTTWMDSEPVRWILSTTIVAALIYLMYALYKYELILPTFFSLACIWSVATMIILVKETINKWLD